MVPVSYPISISGFHLHIQFSFQSSIYISNFHSKVPFAFPVFIPDFPSTYSVKRYPRFIPKFHLHPESTKPSSIFKVPFAYSEDIAKFDSKVPSA